MKRFLQSAFWLGPIVAVLALGIVLALGVLYVDRLLDKIDEAMTGPQFTYLLDDAPDFLTDDLAFAISCEAMNRAGFDVCAWVPQEDGRTSSPNGRTDVYLCRNVQNPNSGTVQFVDAENKRERVVRIELTENELRCQLWAPK